MPVLEESLVAPRITVDMVNAAVKVMIGGEVEGEFRARGTTGEVDVASALVVASNGTVTRSNPEETTERLVLELWLGRSQTLNIAGSDLDVEVHVAYQEAAELGDVAEPEEGTEGESSTSGDSDQLSPASNPLEIRVDSSQVELSGVVNPSLVITSSNAILDHCSGAAALELEGGTARVADHEGSLDLRGLAAEFTLDTTNGRVTFALAGGGLYARDTQGLLSGQADEATVQIDSQIGPTDLRGTDTSFDLRSGRGGVKLVGAFLDVGVSQWAGSVEARLTGGGVRGDGWRSTASVTATEGAFVEVRDVIGPMTLTLGPETSATVGRVRKGLKAGLDQAYLEASDVKNIDLSGRSSEVVLSGIRKLDKLEAVDSELDLDLRDMHGKQKLVLHRGTRATVELTSPCQVLTTGVGAAGGAVVNGCEHAIRRAGRRQSTTQGSLAVRLIVALDEDASLMVDGSP